MVVLSAIEVEAGDPRALGATVLPGQAVQHGRSPQGDPLAAAAARRAWARDLRPHPGGGRRGRHQHDPERDPAARGLRGHQRRRRARGARGHPSPRPRPDPARRDDAARGRARGAAPHPGARAHRAHAGDHAHRQGRARRQDEGLRARRRRLRGQALRAGRRSWPACRPCSSAPPSRAAGAPAPERARRLVHRRAHGPVRPRPGGGARHPARACCRRSRARVAGLDAGAVLRSSTMVGGDFFDIFPMGERLGVVVGDVSGKGIPAALLMVMVRTLLREIARDLPRARGGAHPAERLALPGHAALHVRDAGAGRARSGRARAAGAGAARPPGPGDRARGPRRCGGLARPGGRHRARRVRRLHVRADRPRPWPCPATRSCC